MNREILFRAKHIHTIPGNEHLNGTCPRLGNQYLLEIQKHILQEITEDNNHG